MSVLVRMCHIRKAVMCSRGSRAFFKKHGLDWSTFLKEGIPAEELEATGDAMAIKVCKVAREWAEAAKRQQ